MNKFSSGMLLRLLQVSVIGVFLGRAWQHLHWDAPYRALLWDENWMRSPVSYFLGMEWGEYVSSPWVDEGIQWLIQATGVFYLGCALAALLITRFPKICRFLLILGGISLIFLAFLYTKERFYWWPKFFEYSLQWGSPFLLLAYYRRGAPPKFVFWTKVAIALTFTSHGLFATGVYPTPGYFIEMVIYILGLDQANAVLFLNIAGILDLIISFLLFLPGQWSVLAGLGYAVAWGFATTIARVWAYSIILSWDQVLVQWLHESVMRIPHFLVPLFLLLYLFGRYRFPAAGSLKKIGDREEGIGKLRQQPYNSLFLIPLRTQHDPMTKSFPYIARISAMRISSFLIFFSLLTASPNGVNLMRSWVMPTMTLR